MGTLVHCKQAKRRFEAKSKLNKPFSKLNKTFSLLNMKKFIHKNQVLIKIV